MDFNVVVEGMISCFITVEASEFLLFRKFSENNCKFLCSKVANYSLNTRKECSVYIQIFLTSGTLQITYLPCIEGFEP